MIRPPPRSTLFPYPPLFRSRNARLQSRPRTLHCPPHGGRLSPPLPPTAHLQGRRGVIADRKSTRLNSSHSQISYAVFCLKKKKKSTTTSQCRLRSQMSRDS